MTFGRTRRIAQFIVNFTLNRIGGGLNQTFTSSARGYLWYACSIGLQKSMWKNLISIRKVELVWLPVPLSDLLINEQGRASYAIHLLLTFVSPHFQYGSDAT